MVCSPVGGGPASSRAVDLGYTAYYQTSSILQAEADRAPLLPKLRAEPLLCFYYPCAFAPRPVVILRKIEPR